MLQQLLDGSAVLLAVIEVAGRKDGATDLCGLLLAEGQTEAVVERLVAVGERAVLRVFQPAGLVDGVEDNEELGLGPRGRGRSCESGFAAYAVGIAGSGWQCVPASPASH